MNLVNGFVEDVQEKRLHIVLPKKILLKLL